MTLKDKLMNNYEDRVKMENAIKDSRQVKEVIAKHCINKNIFNLVGIHVFKFLFNV